MAPRSSLKTKSNSIPGPLLFLIYINDLSENLASKPELFANDTSLFSVVKNIDASNIDLNSDLRKMGEWAFQWKMNFNPDPTKQAQELSFSRKVQMINHPPLFFNQNVVLQILFLDRKLNFRKHLRTIFQKTNNTIGFLRKFQTLLPSAPLIIIYKSFIRPRMGYGDMIYYDQTFLMSFQQKLETIQDNSVLAIIGAIRAPPWGYSKEKLNQELGLETLQQRRWCKKLCCFYKILKSQPPKYVHSIFPTHSMSYRTRQSNKISGINVKRDFFRNTFISSTIIEWNKPD